MNLSDFKIIKNRQRPDLCWKYERKKEDLIYSIFTMNSGLNFQLTIEKKRLDKKFYSELSKGEMSIEQCLDEANQYDLNR